MMIKISVYFRKSLTPSCASVPVLVMQLADLIGLHHQLLLQLVGGQRVLQQLDLQPGRLVQDLESHTHTNIHFTHISICKTFSDSYYCLVPLL